MHNLKIWWIVSLNVILIYPMTTIATSNDNNLENVAKNDCCSHREKRAINEKLNDTIKVAEGVSLTPNELSKTDGKIHPSVERNASPSVVPRKGAVPDDIEIIKGIENVTESATIESIEPVKTGLELHESKNITNSNNKTEQLLIGSTNTTQLNTENSAEINSINNTTIKHINTIKKKFRPKPTVTSVVGNDDDNSKRIIHGSPTKSPPLGMPTKINYVVPVIIIILILPLFVISMIYIYKNGRDCWEKRHYRRMDFLIDGMYNE